MLLHSGVVATAQPISNPTNIGVGPPGDRLPFKKKKNTFSVLSFKIVFYYYFKFVCTLNLYINFRESQECRIKASINFVGFSRYDATFCHAE